METRFPRPEPAELPLAPKPSPARLLLVRHGQSTWNREHRIQGQLDPPLSTDGRRQAERLGRRLASCSFVAAYSSYLKRAMETARLIGEATDMSPVPTAGLREVYLGRWEGLNIAEIEQRFPEAWMLWTKEPRWDVVPGGEGEKAFETRVNAELDSILARHEHGDVLIVTHGGGIPGAFHRGIRRGDHGPLPFRIDNASISTIDERNRRVRVSGV